MKKRSFYLVLAFVIIASMIITGCAAPAPAETPAAPAAPAENGGETPAEPEAPAAPAEGLTKAVFISDFANESQAYASKVFTKYGAEYGFDITLLDGKGDAQIQAQAVGNAVAQGAEVIFINPFDVKAIVPSLMEAKAAGVKIGLFSSDLAPESASNRDFFVGANDNDAGVFAAQAILNKFPEGAKVVEVMGQAGHDAQIKRHDGFTQAIEGKNIEVLDSQAAQQWATADALAIMEDFIVKNGDKIQAVFCHWDNGAKGVIEALKAANMNDVYLVAVDGCKAGFDQVRAGDQGATIMQNFVTMVKDSLTVARKALDGEAYDAVNFIKFDIITSDNIADFEVPEW